MTPSEPASLFRPPWRTYLWLVVLLATLLFSPRERPSGRLQATGADAVHFATYLDCERTARMLLALRSVSSRAQLRGEDPPRQKAIAAFDRLARTTRSPRIARRALVSRAALGAPFDPTLVDDLARDLHAAGTRPPAIAAERRFWQALYGPGAATPDRALLPSLQLGFWSDQALADLERRRGDTSAARIAAARFHTRLATWSALANGLVLLALLAALTGLALLIHFLIQAWQGRWHRIGRVATEPIPLSGGALIDGFVFWLMLYRLSGLLVALALPPGSSLLVPAAAVAQLLSGLGGMAYVGRGAWRTLGVCSPAGWRSDLLYGVAGYLATIPAVIALAYVSRLFFERTGIATTPNPILPLAASDQSLALRLTLFVMAAVLAPLIEEFFFRGSLLTALRTRLRAVPAALLCSIVFAVGHPMQDWLPICGLGVALATLREMRQSLLPGIAAHFCQNAASFVGILLLSWD